MPQARSPRSNAPRLRSVQIVGTEEIPQTPRRPVSVYQAVALGRGYTVKAGAATRARLYRGVPRPVEWIADEDLRNASEDATMESTPTAVKATYTTTETKD